MHQSGTNETYQLQSFSGPFTAEIRAHPTLRWLEAYSNNIKALGFADPAERWYASSSVHTNCDGRMFHGGNEIWEWVGGDFFGSFDAIDIREHETRIRIVHKGAPAYYEDEYLKIRGPKDADVLLYEHVILFSPKDPKLKQGGPIAVRRMMECIIGKGENGQGFEGLQCWQSKICWDRSVVKDEVMRRIKMSFQR